jgi:hypothetical protein
MSIFRQYIAPLIVVVVFFIALLAVSARIFLPTDMAAPAPIEEIAEPTAAVPVSPGTVAGLTPTLKTLVQGLPDTEVVTPL